MCKRLTNTRPCGEKKRLEAVSAFGNAAAHYLNLPQFSASVPTVVGSDPRGAKWAQLALLWLDAGFLDDADQGSPAELVRLAVSRWVDQWTGGLQYLSQASVFVNIDVDEMDPDYDEQIEDAENKWQLTFASTREANFQFVLQRKLEALEAAVPGLGETAWAVFVAASNQMLPIATPAWVREQFSYLYWFGEDNNADYFSFLAAELGVDASEPDLEDLIRAEYEELYGEELPVTPAEYDDAFAKWVLSPKMKVSRGKLQKLASKHSSQEIRTLAALLVEAMQSDGSLPQLGPQSPIRADPVYGLIEVRWSEDDMLPRAIDDRLYAINQGDGSCYTDALGAEAVPMDRDGFLNWKRAMEAGFSKLKCLEKILPLIADITEE